MKYIKLYEELNVNEPKAGDWIICEEDDNEIRSFIDNNIGRIISKESYPQTGVFYYIVEYDNVPYDIMSRFRFYPGNCRNMLREEIKYWSNDKSELESILQAKKYNI